MASDLAHSLAQVIEGELVHLQAVTEEQATEKPEPDGGWTRKEELGHLLDSAANNHMRFVLATLAGELRGPTYDQEGWVRLHGYNELPWRTLVSFWHLYNGLLVHVIDRIPQERLDAQCSIGAGAPVTLKFVIADYVLHLQHHLDHILGREKVTEYPGAAAGNAPR